MHALPTEPFNRRIEVLFAVVDTPEELGLATQLLEARGWAVRPWDGSDPDAIGAGRRGLLVEVRMYGARLGAVRAAVSEIERLARGHQAGMWVVDAVLVEHELDHDYRTQYQVRQQDDSAATRPFSPQAVRRALTSLRIVMRPGRPNLELVTERLEQGALTGRPFDPLRHQLRVPAGMEGRDAAAPQPDSTTPAWRIALPLLVGLVLALTAGFALASFEGFPLLMPILMIALLVWPIGRSIMGTRDQRPLRLQLAWGGLAVGMMTAFGLMLALVAPGPLPEVARVLTYASAGLAVSLFIVYGLAYALVHSWFSRNANWAVPALVPALALTLPWFGGLLHTMYLGTGFGIPADAVPVSLYWRYLASLKPLGLAFALTLLWIAIAGWMRHYHQWTQPRVMATVALPLMCVVVFGISVLAGMGGAQLAAGRAWTAARAGKTPVAYYGLEGRLVCVKPVDKKIPVFNGPLDSKEPLLTFGASGDRVWLWDPRRTESLSVRLEDVIVTEARQSGCG
ncbi:hypothetical protein AB0D78_01585 [Streptomyces avermitilis]|uniref:hypothetical protein n=1 Tax=Streptomyces avermitilis TaxID=33903 RepID=UPI0033ECB74C